MLEPLARHHLLEALKPPEGYDLDQAIGTTYSLDLMALLTVPLSFALFDWQDNEGGPTTDPLGLLEAIRRYSGRVTIFCQAGGINIPHGHGLLLHNLETMVHEVQAPRKGGIFHPKVWVLRFVSVDNKDSVLYRVLCLTRNLTFDRSWDTVLVLDGELIDRERAIAANHPLGNFVAALPSLVTRKPAPAELRKRIALIADELRRVRFQLPDGFLHLEFHALGLEDSPKWQLAGRLDRLMVLSPFLDPHLLEETVDAQRGDILVSRYDTLAALPPEVLRAFSKIYYLDPDAEPDNPEDNDGDATLHDSPLHGLHAKLYVADAGRYGRLWTGSANATTAGFSRNVEFMVEFAGKKNFCGVEALLSMEKGATRFADLLREYVPSGDYMIPDADQRAAEQLVKDVSEQVIQASLSGWVTAADPGPLYNLDLRASCLATIPEGVTLRVWPVTKQESTATALLLASTPCARFTGFSFEALTTFIAFSVVGRVGRSTARGQFVLNLPIAGLPDDRSERLLRLLLSSPGQVVRYLLLLLADGETGATGGLSPVPIDGNSDGDAGKGVFADVNLLELLLHALHRHPATIDRIAKLVKDLGATPEGLKLLPDKFAEVWAPIWAVRQEIHRDKR